MTNVMNIASQPVWGVISDKTRSVRRCFIWSICLSALCVIGIPTLSDGTLWHRGLMLAMLVALYFFLTPANMLMEMWLVRVNDNPALNISYGSVRLWASLGFALINLAYVPVLERLPVASIYYFYIGFAALCVAAAAWVPAESECAYVARPRQWLRDMPFKRILNYWVLSYMVFEILFQIPFAWHGTYMVYALNSFGVPSERYGAFLFVSGVFEIPVLLCGRRFIRRFGLAWPIFICAVMLMAEYAFYAWGTSMAALLAAQVMRGFGFAVYVTCRHQFIHKISAPDLENSTLALINSACAGVNMICAALGGFILQAVGNRSFFAILAAIQLLSGTFFIAVLVVGVRVFKMRLPNAVCGLNVLRRSGE